MTPSFLTHWFSEPLVHALCWTLIHSLWIGLLAAGLAGIAMIVTPKAPSRVRYQLFCGVLLLFSLASGAVFYWELTTTGTEQTLVGRQAVSAGVQNQLVMTTGIVENDVSIIRWLVDFVNRESVWIFTIWLVFFMYRSLKLIGGLYQVHRIRTQKVKAASKEWKNKLASFSQTLGINRPIRLLESELVNIPVTVGLFKPVILLPMGLLFQLPPEQIETILWHELAHISRRDYLVNLLQSLLEIVFFFNPGIVWLSSVIREEREACCDDIVLAHTTGKSYYVEALLAFQLQAQLPANSMVLGLGSHQLVNRLRRMVTAENKRLSLIEKVTLLIGLVLVSAFLVIPQPELAVNQRSLAQKKKEPVAQPFVGNLFTTKLTSKKLPKQASVKHTVAGRDTLPVAKPISERPKYDQLLLTSILFVNNNHDMVNRKMFVVDNQGNQYRLTVVNSKLVALDINDKAVPEGEIDQHQELLRQVDEAFAESQRVKQAKMTEATAQSESERQRQLQAWTDAQQRKMANRGQEVRSEKLAKKGSDKFLSQKLTQAEGTKAEPSTNEGKKHLSQTKPEPLKVFWGWTPKKMPRNLDNTYDRDRVLGVMAALVQNHVVADQTKIEWFGLSDTELMVNGVRQSSELHQQLKEKYEIQPNRGLYYGLSPTGGKGIIFEKEDLVRE